MEGIGELGIIYIIISILYIIERKPINILINYIGITIIIAISILNPSYGAFGDGGGEYISYIIIMVQVSAITIIFGFIIMLYQNKQTSSYNNNNNTRKYLIIIMVIISSLYIYKKYIPIPIPEQVSAGFTFTPASNSNSKVLTKIGELLYISWEEDGYTNLSKLLIITLILLLAIVALFLAHL